MRAIRSRRGLLLLLATGALACAPDLRDDFPFDGAGGPTDRVVHTELGEGLRETVVNASDKAAWVYLDLDTGEELDVPTALATQAWELAFQRFKIITNSGISGPGGVGTAVLPGADFDALVQAPAEGYREDRPDGADGNTDLDSAFLEGDGWYAYSLSEHRLKALDRVFVIRTTAGRYAKLQLTDYYSAAGSSGYLTFRWAPLEPPAP